MPTDKVSLLLRHPHLAGVDTQSLERLADTAIVLELGADEQCLEEGTPVEAVYLVAEGVVRVFHKQEDVEVTVTHLVAPNFFGEMEVIATQPRYLESVTTVQRTLLVSLQAKEFLRIVESCPQFSARLLRDICQRFCSAATREHAMFFNVETRMAALLLEYVNLFGRTTKEGVTLRVNITRKSLANSLGITEKSVTRCLATFTDRGWIIRRKGWLCLTDVDAMRASAPPRRFILSHHLDPQPTDP